MVRKEDTEQSSLLRLLQKGVDLSINHLSNVNTQTHLVFFIVVKHM